MDYRRGYPVLYRRQADAIKLSALLMFGVREVREVRESMA